MSGRFETLPSLSVLTAIVTIARAAVHNYHSVYVRSRVGHAHFSAKYWSGQNRTSRTACAGPAL